MLVIPATASTSISSDDVSGEIKVVSFPASVITHVTNVSTFSYEFIYIPVASAICKIDTSNTIQEILPNIVSVTTSTLVEPVCESIFIQTKQTNIQAKATTTYQQDNVTISGTTAISGVGNISKTLSPTLRVSATSAQTNPIIHQTAIACPSVSSLTTLKIGKVSEIVAVIPFPLSVHASINSLNPSFIPSLSPLVANAQAKTPTTEKSLEHVFVSVFSVPVAAIVESVIPDIEVPTSSISATTVVNDTWSAGVPYQAHCWTVLGVLGFESVSIWEPGRGIPIRGKSDGVWLKGMSDETKLRGKSSEIHSKGIFEKV